MCSLQVNYVSVEKVGEPNKPPTHPTALYCKTLESIDMFCENVLGRHEQH